MWRSEEFSFDFSRTHSFILPDTRCIGTIRK
jgi:hypothetical protein